ncbi:hypothetical protein [Vibrio phage RYC]|nr:hypothetical protein [Vibrio phage RYC]
MSRPVEVGQVRQAVDSCPIVNGSLYYVVRIEKSEIEPDVFIRFLDGDWEGQDDYCSLVTIQGDILVM